MNKKIKNLKKNKNKIEIKSTSLIKLYRKEENSMGENCLCIIEERQLLRT